MNSFSTVFILWITQLVMLVGLFGLIVPVLPGLVVIWLAALGYGIVQGFSTAGIVIFIVLTLLMIGGSLIDNLFLSVGAHQGGASWSIILVGLAAGILGTLLFPPIGGVIALPLVILVLVYARVRDWRKAWQSLGGMATGWGLSIVVRFLIGLGMNALWWVWVWWG